MSTQRGDDNGNLSIRTTAQAPFQEGAVVVVWLHDPREQFWGELGSLNSAGIVMHGLSLASFEDSSRQHRNGEVTLPSALFFPMHRVERIEIDQRVGDIPSLLERFSNTTEESLRWLHSTKDGH